MNLIRGGRDTRVDFFRGLALWWIFTDHVPGNILGGISLHNFALCDATEVFVLLAGYAGGLVYGRALDRHGWLFAGADVLRRAWTLYVAHIFLFVVFVAQVSYSAGTLDRADFLEEVNMDALGDQPYQALLEALKLHFQPAFLDILPMYIVLLLQFALVLPLLHRPRVLALLSLGLYVAARSVPLEFPSWTGGTWFFNPMTWQLLFMLGALASYLPVDLRAAAARRFQRPLDVLAGIVVVLGIALQWFVWADPRGTAHLNEWISWLMVSVDKTGLHPFRLASIMALVWVVARLVPPEARWLRTRWAGLFTLPGQHSLPVFCVSIFLSFLGRLALQHSDGLAMQTAVNLLGGTAMICVGALAAWYRIKGSEPAHAEAAARPGPHVASEIRTPHAATETRMPHVATEIRMPRAAGEEGAIPLVR